MARLTKELEIEVKRAPLTATESILMGEVDFLRAELAQAREQERERCLEVIKHVRIELADDAAMNGFGDLYRDELAVLHEVSRLIAEGGV